MSIEEPRSINEVQPNEVDVYSAIPGWRIWTRTIFSREPHLSAAREAEVKKMALLSRQFDKGYAYIYHKLEELEMRANPRRPRMPFGPGAAAFDMPWYILEPLTEQEVKTIDELGEAPGPAGSIDKPDELLRPDEMRRILAEPGRPQISGDITLAMLTPREAAPELVSPPKIQYRFDRFSLNGHTNHYAHVLYGSEHLQGAQLAEAQYRDGEMVSVSLKYGSKEELLEKHSRKRLRRRGFVFGGHGPALFPSHQGVRLVANGNEFEVLDDEEIYLGQRVGTLKEGEIFTHPTIPYTLDLSYPRMYVAFKRISSDGLEWELVVPRRVPITGREEFPISFTG